MTRSNLPVLCVVATRALAELVRGQMLGRNLPCEWTLIEQGAGDALPALEAMAAAGRLDAVIAAGQGAEGLRQRLEVPVVQIRVSAYDILQALMAARSQGARAVLLTRRRLGEELLALRAILNLDIEPLIYDSDADARRHLATLSLAARPVVIGSSQIVHLAGEYGLPTVLIYSPDSVLNAFDAALELTRVARVEERKRESLDRILESLAEGVVAVDMDERVQSINPALAGLLGLRPGQLIGERLTRLVPALSLADVLRTGEAHRDGVVELAGRRLVTQQLPLFEAGEQVGAVLTLQESAAIERADRKLRAEARKRPFRARYSLADVLGESPAIVAARELAALYAGADSAVLIEGASGTGKELFAQGIHQLSRRAAGPFVALNCAAFPDGLLESELFGYEEGAFTGSRRGGKPGLIELGDRGTLFLDEIGDMPLPLQTRLLRVLQEREVLRLGAAEPIPVDVRVIAATHAKLPAAVAAGRFRADLYYRLNILSLPLPPLAERGSDLRLLASKLAADALLRLGGSGDGDLPAALVDALLAVAADYAWPGNVRELQNIIERLAVFLRAAGRLAPADVRRLAPELSSALRPAVRLVEAADAARRTQAAEALRACGGDRAQAAQRLGISRTTLWRLLREA